VGVNLAHRNDPDAADRAGERGSTQTVRIRSAGPHDVPLVFSLIGELAEYERAAERVVGSEPLLHTALFGPNPVAEAIIAEMAPGDGGASAPVGFALFFRTFSTWLCRPGLWLEDLYVSPPHRRAGVGRLLLSHVAQVAVDRGYGRVEWSALHWNTPALRFYDSIGAVRLDEWKGFRLEEGALVSMAEARE
jgi:GNAT superfamily N-acetyltransferase